jgi:arylsulfatase A-like enzyme
MEPRPKAPTPNVLFVITDQQRADHAGFAGNQVVRTPNLDALASRGTVFDNAWAANPVCMPNRSSIMTGRMPSAHGVIFNDRSLEWTANTFVRMFRAAGYRTALLGKSHLQHGMSRRIAVPVPAEPTVFSPLPEGWDRIEEYERYLDRWTEADDPDDFYGFDRIRLSIDHGARVSGHHLRWALERGGRIDDLLTPHDPTAPGVDRSERWWQIYRPPYGPELHSTSFVMDQTVGFIAEATAEGRPWLAFCSFPDPHHPVTPPGPWFDRHHADAMDLPATIDDPMTGGLTHLRRVRDIAASSQNRWVTPFGAGDHHLVREMLAATYGAIEMIDDAVGRIWTSIRQLGQADNTIVVFTSDHGDMMGDHGLMLKGYMPYRGTHQVPLMLAGPGVTASQRTSSLVSSIDLAPTLLDLCSLPDFNGIQGRSLAPVLSDRAVTVQDRILTEDDCPPMVSGGYVPLKTRTVTTSSLRYTRTSDGQELLFDLTTDPNEMVNLATVDPRLRAEAVDALATALLDADDLDRFAPAGGGLTSEAILASDRRRHFWVGGWGEEEPRSAGPTG